MNGLTFTDIFCGAGGSSIGLAAAGFELKLAANHWARAIETHAANFRDAEHLCADVNNYDMRRLPKTRVLWASPICTEVSPAGGGNRRNAQMDLLEEHGHVSRAAFDRTRATFHDVIRAAEVHRYDVVFVENVPEVVERWELFDWWIDGMKRLGYTPQFVSVSSAHVGGENNPWAPQWRDRLYIVFTYKGIPLPDVQLRPIAYCPKCEQDVGGVQVWGQAAMKRLYQVGRYRRQYWYHCPECGGRVEPYIVPAAAAIDWTDLGQKIGERARPLSKNTIKRIEAGLKMFAQPVVATVAGNTYERPGSGYYRVWPANQAPLPTRTATAGDAVVMPQPFLTSIGREGSRPRPIFNEVALTIAASGNHHFLATPEPFITMLRNHAEASGIQEPLRTIAAHGNHHYLTTPPGSFYVKNYGGKLDPKDAAKSVGEPLGTMTTHTQHSLVVPYYRTGKAHKTDEPLHTVTGRDRFALVTPEETIQVEDCHYRMIQPRESLRAQRFPDSYIVHGNRGEQTMQAGNAVSANVAQWLGERVMEVLDGA